MFKIIAATFAVVWAVALTGGAQADESSPGTVLRLIGDAPALGQEGPAHFVIDARVTKDEGETHGEVKGWFTTLPPQSTSAEVEGSCVDRTCELTVDLSVHKLTLSGEMIGLSGKTQGRFKTSDNDPGLPLPAAGAVSFTPFTDTVPGLGELVKPDGIGSWALDDLLQWAGVTRTFGDDDDHPIKDYQYEHLQSWQQSNSLEATGLLLTSGLAQLTTQRAAARKAVGWVTLGGRDLGWSAGYPALLLPKASRAGVEQRFASVDGKASLIIAIDPPLSNDDFDALADKLIHHPEPGRTNHDYTRTGPDMEVSSVEAGMVTSTVYYNRETGLARLIFTYPEGDKPFADIDPVVGGSLRVTDALKPAP